MTHLIKRSDHVWVWDEVRINEVFSYWEIKDFDKCFLRNGGFISIFKLKSNGVLAELYLAVV